MWSLGENRMFEIIFKKYFDYMLGFFFVGNIEGD